MKRDVNVMGTSGIHNLYEQKVNFNVSGVAQYSIIKE